MARNFRSSLQLALAAIGRKNGHAPHSGGSNIDPQLHHYMVDTEAESFFAAQRKRSRAAMLEVVPEDALKRLDDIVAAAKKQRCKQPTAALVDTGNYVLNIDVKKPASRLDTVALRNKLIRDSRYTRSEVERLYNECTKESEPAKTIIVSPLFD